MTTESDRPANDALLDRAIRAALIAERFKNHEVRRIVRMLQRDVFPDLRARLAARLENIATRGFDIGPTTTARLKFLYRDLREFFDMLGRRLSDETGPALLQYAKVQAEQLAREIGAEVGAARFVRKPTAATLRAGVLKRQVSGLTLGERWEKRSRAFRTAVETEIRIGLVEGQTPQQIIARIRATFPRQAKATARVVRVGVAHAQAQARQAVFEENADLLAGVQFHATLDDATCPICGALDGQVFPVDKGPRPPMHEGPCRCTTSPVLKSARDLGFTRASMNGQVPDTVKWADWIGEQPASVQDEALGKGVASLFRAGRIGVGDLVGAGGRLTLEQLESL